MIPVIDPARFPAKVLAASVQTHEKGDRRVSPFKALQRIGQRSSITRKVLDAGSSLAWVQVRMAKEFKQGLFDGRDAIVLG